VIGTYAVGFPRQSVQRLDLAGLARFTLEDLGAPLGTLQPLTRRTQFWNQQQVTIDPRWAFVIGLFSVVLLALNLGSTRAWRERAFLARIMPWCCLALFSAACAVFTGLGRGTEANAALTSRYQNFAVLWWIALVAIGTLTAWRVWVARQRWHTWPRLLIGVNLLTLVLGTGAYFEVNLTSAAAALDWHQTLRDTESCVHDFTTASDSCMLLLHLSPAAARLRLAQMAEHHLALYRDGPIPSVPGPLGKPGSVPDRTSLREVAYQTLYQIDGLPGALALFDGIQGTLNARADQPLVLTGWALDVAALPIGPADGVYLTLDDQAARWVPLDRERPDVARRFAAAYLRSGFRAEWPTGTLAPGRHTVKIEVVAANRRGIYPPSTPLEFTVR